MSRKQLVAGLVLLMAVLVAGSAVWSQRVWLAATPKNSVQPDRYQALLDAQAGQDERMDRIESMLASMAGNGAGTSSTRSARMHAEHGTGRSLTPAEKQARYEQAQRDAEARFAAEPVSRTWASRNERMIAGAFSTESLAAKNAPVPRLHNAQCRSETCRIELVYGNELTSEEGMLFLLSDIGGTLGKSQPFQRVLPDGSVHLVLYSTAAPPPRQGIHGH